MNNTVFEKLSGYRPPFALVITFGAIDYPEQVISPSVCGRSAPSGAQARDYSSG